MGNNVVDGTVIAFCGRSACGKDTLADQMCKQNPQLHKIKLDTTRPQRPNENDDAYNFLDPHEFLNKLIDSKYVCCAHYRGWYYGMPKDEIKHGVVNVTAMSPQMLKKGGTNIKHLYIVYVDISPWESLKRSVARQGRLTFEILRRTIADMFDFISFRKWVTEHQKTDEGFVSASTFDEILTCVNEKNTISCGQS